MKLLFIILSCLILSGCASTLDTNTIILLSNRIDQLESGKKAKLTEQRTEIEVYSNDTVSDVLNTPLSDRRKFKIEVLIDSEGNFIIPKDKIVKRYELKTEK